jgi:serine/threonine-protein kinase
LPEQPPGLELIEEIGRGGMGRVFRARHEKLARTVAVKLLPSELAADASFRARFEREARTLARLDHPNIVTVHDFGALWDGAGYLVMEHVAGGSLRERLPLSPTEVTRVLGELCSALAYAHAAGVVHRDLKPENVLFDAQGRARLVDFGIARLLADEQTTLTAPQLVLGTPRYMAPEARLGAHVDARADLFALGVMLREMLGEGDATPERSRLLAIADRASATEPNERYASAKALADALGDELGSPLAPGELPEHELSWLRAVALTLAGATAVSLYAVLVSVTPRVVQPSEAIPLVVFDAQRLADGTLATRARFEMWPTIGAAAAWVVSLVAYGALRSHWRGAGLDAPRPEQPLGVVRPLIRLAVVINALYVAHLALEHSGLRAIVTYIPILGGVLELGMLFLVWSAVLEALRRRRPLSREPALWVAALTSLLPPVVSSLRLWLS